MDSEYTTTIVLDVAKKQKYLIITFFIYLLTVFANIKFKETDYTLIVQSAVLILGVTVVVFVSILSFRVFSKAAAVVFTILCFVPLVNIVVFLIVNSKANKIIKSQGYKVGLAGADLKAIENDI